MTKKLQTFSIRHSRRVLAGIHPEGIHGEITIMNVGNDGKGFSYSSFSVDSSSPFMDYASRAILHEVIKILFAM